MDLRGDAPRPPFYLLNWFRLSEPKTQMKQRMAKVDERGFNHKSRSEERSDMKATAATAVQAARAELGVPA